MSSSATRIGSGRTAELGERFEFVAVSLTISASFAEGGRGSEVVS